jgi:hypothetical protein
MRAWAAAVVVAFLAVTGVAAAQPSVTALQLTKRFKTATGERLRADTRAAFPGHYKAFNLGPESIATRAKWGTFTVYLVTAASPDADVKELLANAHTGLLGTPSAGRIYWEKGTTIHGDVFWLAKKRYGKNVVLWWTTTGARKTDARFARLSKALVAATR